ncbi:Uncharacterised protein [Vibrio cholerae]|nr:Uncharacterised protein [Vibrio cholerae]CSI55123.1 Uncharacterised protein [Vibrio cholerae]
MNGLDFIMPSLDIIELTVVVDEGLGNRHG